MTNEEVETELRSNSALELARRTFRAWRARLAHEKEQDVEPVELRKLEFEAIRDIWSLKP
jgi:hypothetical protein